MANKEVTRGELLERWNDIEKQDDEGDPSAHHPVKRRRFRLLKEQWFADAFNFLISLPKESHIWCGYWDLASPLLETFFNYFKEESSGSPLKLLWNRISEEMMCCTVCIHQHHRAQEIYVTEYDHSCISPLLDVLRTLDEERISQHLKDLNSRILRGEYHPVHDHGEVVSILFEVLMFPFLLDDQSLATDFQNFIEAIDDNHELLLDGNLQYPGVYALFFQKSRRVRSIGLRLAGHMGSLRRSTDLEPLQYLLKKCIAVLETEDTESAAESVRPRTQMDRITVWLGMKSLVGFLEPPAFEEGILDRYPIFLSIVLNHISDDSFEFSHAVKCLRLLFEKLGCKLWLRATLSPSVMRNTLMGQCFHTRNEKSHKEIFDLFQPFLQSLEALQDGEHEKQRRHFLYFLLHQVPVSSNFSTLMRKKASQIALLIVLRGYKMDPPSPPSECAHMWGPSIISSLKDLSLHSSLRQPAIDLIQTIIVSDASALLTMIFSGHFHSNDKPIMPAYYCDDDGDEDVFSVNINQGDTSCWKEFIRQHKIISQVDGSWMCIPMLWFDVFAEVDQVALPLSFSKAVFWALSRVSLIEPENSTEMNLSLRSWLATCTSEISYLLGWKIPSGSDDGGDGIESRNSIKISTMCMPLVRTFKRLMAHYCARMEQQLRKQWIWEPMMNNSLILLLVDPNDNTRQVARLILEQVSGMRGLTNGLQFLCSSSSSLSALLLGLKHALKLVQLDTVSLNFYALHHLFFIFSKLLREGNSSAQTASQNLSAVSNASKSSAQGGFLKQPVFDSASTNFDEHPSIVSSLLWKKFTCLLSQVSWPSIVKCLNVGKTFIGHTVSQMTCIRLLEVIPAVFENIFINSGAMVATSDSFQWLHDLADWGKSSLDILVRYWKQTLTLLLGVIKASCSSKSVSVIYNIEKLILCENIPMDEVSKQVSRLSISLMDENYPVNCTGSKSKQSFSKESSNVSTQSIKDSENLLFDGTNQNILDSPSMIDQESRHVIILSDDEEFQVSAPQTWPCRTTHFDNLVDSCATEKVFHSGSKENDADAHVSIMVSSEASPQLGSHTREIVTEKMSPERMGEKLIPLSPVKAKATDSDKGTEKIEDYVASSFLSHENPILKKAYNETSNSKQFDFGASQQHLLNKSFPDLSFPPTNKTLSNWNSSLKPSDDVLKQVVCDTVDDEWQFSFFRPPRRQQAPITKSGTSGQKRQVIQLAFPVNNRPGFKRLDGEMKRFNPSRLDDWYRPILQFDFFVHVGLASGSNRESENISKLKKIPVCFQSSDEYIEIFRPLVLEELKAQLQNSFQEMSSAEEMCFGSLSVLSVEKIDEFHVVRFVHDENNSSEPKSLTENDLIVLTRKSLQNASGDFHAVGKIERREKDSKRRSSIIAIRLYLQGSSRLNQVRKLLTERSKWHIYRIMSITPQLREFQALSSIREIPLHPIILNPVNQKCCLYDSRTENFSKLSQPMQKIVKSSYNSSQLQAISVAVGPFDAKDFELTLIQGPPGTGKTRTIVAIVSGLLAFSKVRDDKRSRSYGQEASNSFTKSRSISQSTAIARAWQDAALARQLNEDSEKNNKCGRNCNSGRILICAQSNAAVDELVVRISCEGLYGCDGLMYKPYLVRVGNAKTVHPNSLPFFIDTLVENRLQEERKGKNDDKQGGASVETLMTVRANLEKLVDQIRYYEAKHANLHEGNSDSKNLVEDGYMDTVVLSDKELKEKLRVLYEKKKSMYKDLANVQARERKASDEIRALRHKIRMSILKEAQIVVTTLSGCGGDLYVVCSESIKDHKSSYSCESSLFDAVVIDEAAQALEPATLIPLQLLKSLGTKCIMVGDPKQLSATVISNVAGKFMFQCSMFERLQRAGHPVIMLTQQYRMHPDICRFPSLHFYEGKLQNGDQMLAKAASFHETWCLGPYVFFDIVDGRETRGKDATALSMCNEGESDAAVEVLRHCKNRYPSEFSSRSVGVITPYKRQLSLLRSRFSTAFGTSITEKMEFNTVDGFQGREVDILLLSTVRAAGCSSETARFGSSNLGFVADVRRMNVALTRAKLSLWIFGNARTLQTNQDWAALVEDAKQRNLVVSGRKPYSSLFRSVKKNMHNSENILSSKESEQTESVKTANDSGDAQKILRRPTEKKRRYIGTAAGISCEVDDVSRALKDASKDNEISARDEQNAPWIKDQSFIAAQSSINKVLKADKSTAEENKNPEETIDRPTDLETENKDNKSQFSSSQNMKIRSQKVLKPVGSMKTMKHDTEQRSLIVDTSCSDIKIKEKNEVRTSDQVEILADSITKRKQQREAVDALLSSALISSKRSESTLKSSAKRSASTIKTKDYLVRQQKSRKD